MKTQTPHRPPFSMIRKCNKRGMPTKKKVGKHWHRLKKVLTLKRRAAKVFEFGLLDLHMVIFPFILSADGPGKTHQRWPPVASPKNRLAKDRFGKRPFRQDRLGKTASRFGKIPLRQKAALAKGRFGKTTSAKGRFGKRPLRQKAASARPLARPLLTI